MKMYGLRHKIHGNLGIEILSNYVDGISSHLNDIEYRLNIHSDIPFMIEDKKFIENILSKDYNKSWYDSSYEQPVNPYNNKDLEIVEFNISHKSKLIEGACPSCDNLIFSYNHINYCPFCGIKINKE